MIRINLLKTERAAAQAPTGPTSDRRAMVAAVLVLLLAIGGMGSWYWMLRQGSHALDDLISDAEQETARLQTIIAQVHEFERQRDDLQSRVALIEQLRRGQQAPVHLLDQLSLALPDSMWLVEMQQEGTLITIDGRCTSLAALSDFIGGLEQSGYFARPVELVDSQVEPATAQAVELIRFTVRATFVPPEA